MVPFSPIYKRQIGLVDGQMEGGGHDALRGSLTLASAGFKESGIPTTMQMESTRQFVPTIYPGGKSGSKRTIRGHGMS